MKRKRINILDDDEDDIKQIRIPRTFGFNFDIFEGERPRKRKK